MEFEKYTVKGGIQQLPDRPKDSAAELKAKFDEAEKNIGEYINEKLIPELEEMEEYSNIAFRYTGTIASGDEMPVLTTSDAGKVYNILDDRTYEYTCIWEGAVTKTDNYTYIHVSGIYDNIHNVYRVGYDQFVTSKTDKTKTNKVFYDGRDESGDARFLYDYNYEPKILFEDEEEVIVTIDTNIKLLRGENIVWTGHFWNKLSCDTDYKVEKDSCYPVQSGAVYNAIKEHSGNKENPHKVIKEQIGLGNVDNTSDLDKPISTLTQQALDNKENISNKVTEINENSTDEKYPSAKAVWDKFNEKIIDKNVSSSDDFDEFTADYFNFTSGGSVILKGFITSEYNSYILFVQAGHEDVLSTHQTLLITNSYGRRTSLMTRIHASNKWSKWQAYLATDSVRNDLTSTSTTSPLSANQGRVLNEKIGKIDLALDELHNYAQSLINGGAE